MGDGWVTGRGRRVAVVSPMIEGLGSRQHARQ